MPRKLRRWRALPATERWLLVEAAILLPVTRAMLRRLGFVRTRGLLESSVGATIADEIDSASVAAAARVGWLVDVAARHGLFRANCLPRSLVLCWLLRRRGLPARLRIGVRRGPDNLIAHAWVDVGGHLVGEPSSTPIDYTAYESLEPLRSA